MAPSKQSPRQPPTGPRGWERRNYPNNTPHYANWTYHDTWPGNRSRQRSRNHNYSGNYNGRGHSHRNNYGCSNRNGDGDSNRNDNSNNDKSNSNNESNSHSNGNNDGTPIPQGSRYHKPQILHRPAHDLNHVPQQVPSRNPYQATHGPSKAPPQSPDRRPHTNGYHHHPSNRQPHSRRQWNTMPRSSRSPPPISMSPELEDAVGTRLFTEKRGPRETFINANSLFEWNPEFAIPGQGPPSSSAAMDKHKAPSPKRETERVPIAHEEITAAGPSRRPVRENEEEPAADVDESIEACIDRGPIVELELADVFRKEVDRGLATAMENSMRENGKGSSMEHIERADVLGKEEIQQIYQSVGDMLSEQSGLPSGKRVFSLVSYSGEAVMPCRVSGSKEGVITERKRPASRKELNVPEMDDVLDMYSMEPYTGKGKQAADPEIRKLSMEINEARWKRESELVERLSRMPFKKEIADQRLNGTLSAGLSQVGLMDFDEPHHYSSRPTPIPWIDLPAKIEIPPSDTRPSTPESMHTSHTINDSLLSLSIPEPKALITPSRSYSRSRSRPRSRSRYRPPTPFPLRQEQSHISLESPPRLPWPSPSLLALHCSPPRSSVETPFSQLPNYSDVETLSDAPSIRLHPAYRQPRLHSAAVSEGSPLNHPTILSTGGDMPLHTSQFLIWWALDQHVSKRSDAPPFHVGGEELGRGLRCLRRKRAGREDGGWASMSEEEFLGRWGWKGRTEDVVVSPDTDEEANRRSTVSGSLQVRNPDLLRDADDEDEVPLRPGMEVRAATGPGDRLVMYVRPLSPTSEGSRSRERRYTDEDPEFRPASLPWSNVVGESVRETAGDEIDLHIEDLLEKARPRSLGWRSRMALRRAAKKVKIRVVGVCVVVGRRMCRYGRA